MVLLSLEESRHTLSLGGERIELFDLELLADLVVVTRKLLSEQEQCTLGFIANEL